MTDLNVRWAQMSDNTFSHGSAKFGSVRLRPCLAKTCPQAYADSEGPDQTAHPRILIRAFSVR